MNYYDILGLSEQSEPEVIEAAYRALMKKYHPDRWTGKSADAERKAKLINEAYSALRDNRNEYDWPLHPRKPGGRRPEKSKTAPDKGLDRAAARKQPRGRVESKAPRTAFGFLFGRSEMIGIGVLLIGVAALALALAGGTARTPYPIQTMLLPPPRVPLLDGQRLQIFCITNETLNPIQYTIYWGDSPGRNYQINAGSSTIHSSRYSGPPIVEFAQHDGPIEHVRNKGIRARIAIGPSTSCDPNFSFEYLDADIARVSEYDRYGLYPAAPPVPEPASEPTSGSTPGSTSGSTSGSTPGPTNELANSSEQPLNQL